MAEIKGNGSFGVSATDGLAQSKSTTKTADTAELRNSAGDVVGIAFYNKREEINIEIGADSSSTIPDIGDDFEGGIVTSVVQNESNSAFKTYSVTVIKYASIGG